MHKRNGFTLIELLIAATIIGVLVVFATQAFRNTSSQIRVEDAKARAKVVAMAVRRFKIDNPSASVGDETQTLGVVNAPKTNLCNHSTITLQNLVNCGYLDYRQYAAEMRLANGAGDTYKSYFVMTLEEEGNSIKVCVTRHDDATKIVDNTKYCTDGESWD